MSLVRGPFTLQWGDNVITDVEEVDIEYTKESEDLETVQGAIREVDGGQKATVTLTLLDSDISLLAAILPQYFVPNGGVMSTGETVNYAQGAIDVKPHACDEDLLYNHLDIESCANPANVLRIVNARTKLDGITIDSMLRRMTVKFVGEPEGGDAAVQIFAAGTINVVS